MRNSDSTFSNNGKAILQPLDDSAGPAVPLNDMKTELLAQKITECSLQIQRSGSAFFSAAAAVWLLIGLSGTASAAVAVYFLLRQPEMREVKSKEDSDQQQPASAKAVSVATDERYTVDGLQPAASTGDKPDNTDRVSSVSKPSVANQSAVVVNDRNHRIEPPSSVDRPDITNRKVIAADMLEQANRLRASQRWRDAERLYTHVYQSHPRSQKARPAMVAAASLRLEYLNDARGALRLFRKVVRDTATSTVLAEEACFGIAGAHRALGDTTSEIESLKHFLSTYPDSVLAPRARQRLEHVTADCSDTATKGSAP